MSVTAALAAYGATLGFQLANLGLQAWIGGRSGTSTEARKEASHDASVPESRIPGHERFRGWGVMTLPFGSGHVLGLRVMPENDYAPFVAVWHRTPDGAWSMYVDGPHPEEFCPRLFGPALARSGPARIEVRWEDEETLRVTMDEPELDWTLQLRSTIRTRIMNALLPRIPRGFLRRRGVLTAMSVVSRLFLGAGEMDLVGVVPGGQRIRILPRRVELVERSRAILDGLDLGPSASADDNPATGAFRWPRRGIVAAGEIHVAIDDPEEHRRRLARFTSAGA